MMKAKIRIARSHIEIRPDKCDERHWLKIARGGNGDADTAKSLLAKTKVQVAKPYYAVTGSNAKKGRE